MAKHRRLKPIREYLYDKGEMIEQMFSSIPIVEVRNMVPIKLQGMPLHELKAECLVELLEMSDREIMSIIEGKKTRDPSSSDSEAGGVVVLSDDDERNKNEKRSIRRPPVKREDYADDSTTELSISSKKRIKRKSKEDNDSKGKKKKKIESRLPAPSSSKEVQVSKEPSKRKKGPKPAEKPKPPPEEVVVLDVSSDESGNEADKNVGEKSLLDLLELEMRARAIRSLLKQEDETRAKKILSDYKDEPDDLIPVEVPPPQVDLLSDSDEDLKTDEGVVQPSTFGSQMEIVDNTLPSEEVDVVLGITANEAPEVVVIADVNTNSADLVKVNRSDNCNTNSEDGSAKASLVDYSINEPSPSSSKESGNKPLEDHNPSSEVTIKVESSGNSNEQKIDDPVVKVPPISVETSSVTTITTTEQTVISPEDHSSSLVKVKLEPDDIPPDINEPKPLENEHGKTTAPKVSSIECSKSLSVSTGDEYHSHFEEDILDYDYDPSLNNPERLNLHLKPGGTSCPQNLMCETLAIKSEKLEEDCAVINEQIDKRQESDGKEKQSSTSESFQKSNLSSIKNNLDGSDCRKCVLIDDQLGHQTDGTVTETEVVPHTGGRALTPQRSNSSNGQVIPKMLTYEEVSLDISDTQDDCSQLAEGGLTDQKKDRVTPFVENQQSDKIINSLETPQNHFLVNDALGCFETASNRINIKSQEHNQTVVSIDKRKHMAKDDLDTSNPVGDDALMQSRSEDQKMPPDNKPAVKSQILVKSECIPPDTCVKNIGNDCSLTKSSVKIVSENALCSVGHCEGGNITDLLVSNHNFSSNATGLVEATPNIKLISDADISSVIDRDSSINSVVASSSDRNTRYQDKTKKGVDATNSDQYHPEVHLRNEDEIMQSHYDESVGLPSVKTEKLLIGEQTLHDISEEGKNTECVSNIIAIAPLNENKHDFSRNDDLDYLVTKDRTSQKPSIVTEEPKNPLLMTQENDAVLTKKIKIECANVEHLENNDEQHFLVNVALDSLDAEVSETEAGSQEHNYLSSRKVGKEFFSTDSRVLKQNTPVATFIVSREIGMSKRLNENNEQSVIVENDLDLLKSETDVTHPKLAYPVVGNVEDNSVSVSISSNPDISSKGVGDRDFVYHNTPHTISTISSSSTRSNREEGERSGNKMELNPSSDIGENAFVGCNSIAIQKDIKITDGQTTRQPFIQDDSSLEVVPIQSFIKNQGSNFRSSKYFDLWSENEFDKVACKNYGEHIKSSHSNSCFKNQFSTWNELCSKTVEGTSHPVDSRPTSASPSQIKESFLRSCLDSSLINKIKNEVSESGNNNSDDIEMAGKYSDGKDKLNLEKLGGLKKTKSYLVDHRSVSSESPPINPSNLEPSPSLVGKITNSSGTGNNSHEVIEIHDEVSGDINSQNQTIFKVSKCCDDMTSSITNQEVALSGPSTLAKKTNIEASHSSPIEDFDVDAIETGNTYSSKVIKTDDDGTFCNINLGKRDTQKNECLTKNVSNTEVFVPFSPSGCGNNSLEVIEIYDDDSNVSNGKENETSRMPERVKKICSSPEDSVCLSLPSPAKPSASGTSHLSFSEVEFGESETGIIRSEIPKNDEIFVAHNTSAVKQMVGETEGLKEMTSNSEDHSNLFLSSPKTDLRLDITQPPLFQEGRTCKLGTNNETSEIIEINDSDSDCESSDRERTSVSYNIVGNVDYCCLNERNSQGAECQKEISNLEDPSFKSAPSSPIKASNSSIECEQKYLEVIQMKDESLDGRYNISEKNKRSMVTEGLEKGTSNVKDSFISSHPSEPLGSELAQSSLNLDVGNICEIIEIDDEGSADSSSSNLPSSPTEKFNLKTKHVSSIEKVKTDNCGTEAKAQEDVTRSVKEQQFQGAKRPNETRKGLEDAFLSKNISSVHPVQSTLNQVIKTCVLESNHSDLIVTDDSCDSSKKEPNTKAIVEPLKKKTLNILEDPCSTALPSSSTKVSRNQAVRVGELVKENDNNDVIEIDDEDLSGNASSEEEQLKQVTEHLKNITSSLEDPCSFTNSSLIQKVRTTGLKTGNTDCEIINIDDEHFEASQGERSFKETECLKVTTSDPLLSSASSTKHTVSNSLSSESSQTYLSVEYNADRSEKSNNNSEVIEIDDEDSSDSSSDGEEESSDGSDSSMQDDEQSSSSVYSISDDENPVSTKLNKGRSFGKEDIQPDCTTFELTENKGLQVVEYLLPTAVGTKSDAIITISDGEDESADSSIGQCQDNESVSEERGKNDQRCIMTHSPGSPHNIVNQAIDCTKSGTLLSNEDNVVLNPQEVKNGPKTKVDNGDGNKSVCKPCKEPVSLVNVELEEGEIEEDDTVEILESEGVQTSKALGTLSSSSVGRVCYPDTGSDTSADSHHRKRRRKRVKLRKKIMRVTSDESRETQSIKQKNVTIKDQENRVSLKSGESLISAQKELSQPTLTISEQLSPEKHHKCPRECVNTIVIEDDVDDDKIVQAITEQMPPEILELDDSDEAKTNWTARWLESTHVKKVVTTSKILTNARKKLKLKLKIKDPPVIEAAPTLTEVPQLIGSVEEYHRLVKEGVIASSTKSNATEKSVVDTGPKERESVNSSETIPLREVATATLMAKVDDGCLGKRKFSEKVQVIPKVHDEKSISHEIELEGEIETNCDGLSLTSSSAAARDDGLEVKDKNPLSKYNSSVASGPAQQPRKEDEECKSSLASNSVADSLVCTNDALESEMDKSSKSVDVDPLSGCIESFYEMVKANQVTGIASSLKLLSDITFPSSALGKVETKCTNSLSITPTSPSSATCSSGKATLLNDLHLSSEIIIPSPSSDLCNSTENNTISVQQSKQLDNPKLLPGKELEDGEIEDSDFELENSVYADTSAVNRNSLNVRSDKIVNTNSQIVQLPVTTQSVQTVSTSVQNVCAETAHVQTLAQPVLSSSTSTEHTSSTRENPIVPGSNDLHEQVTPKQSVQSISAENATVRSIPSIPHSSSQIIGLATAIAQCDNTATSFVHSTHSTFSSVTSPSNSISVGQVTPFMGSSALQSPAVSGVQTAFPPINPIQAAAAEISNIYQYATPPSGLAQPQMSVNLNSTLNSYNQYYNWMYHQGLSGSMNSSYGYGVPDQSQDASTIYKQWGEYYKKLMEACEDSAVRASIGNMVVPAPPNLEESKGYSWVYQRPHHTPASVNNPETSVTVPIEVDPVQSQAPSKEWNYRYGLKGLLNEHFITPGAATATETAPAAQAVSISLQGRCGPSRRRPRRGRWKKKK